MVISVCRRIIWVCLTILRGWRLKGYSLILSYFQRLFLQFLSECLTQIYKSEQSRLSMERSIADSQFPSWFSIFTLLCGVSKGFMKAFKAFIKPFEAPQRSVKIKIWLDFFLRPGLGREVLIFESSWFWVFRSSGISRSATYETTHIFSFWWQ